MEQFSMIREDTKKGEFNVEWKRKLAFIDLKK